MPPGEGVYRAGEVFALSDDSVDFGWVCIEAHLSAIKGIEMTETYVLGLDIGYGGLKVAGGLANFKVPVEGQGLFGKRSTAARAERVNKRLDGSSDGYEVLVGGETFRTCFDPARVVSAVRNLSEAYSTTDEYRALFHTALMLSGRTRIDLLVTGLPMVQFKDEQVVKALEHWMTGAHEVQPGRVVTVMETKVIAQPYGGFMDFLYRQSNGLDVEDATVVVIDPGTYSVDWSVFSKLVPLADINSSSNTATYAMLERVAAFIKEDHKAKVSIADIETKVIEGRPTMLAAGHNVDLMPYIDRAAREIVPSVMRQIIPRLEKLDTAPDRIVLVGGGAVFYESTIRSLYGDRIVVVPEAPVLANARGFYLYGCQSMQRGD